MIKKIQLISLLILAICLFCGCHSRSPESKKTLHLGTNVTYPPYESYNKNGEVVGFDIDIAHAIANKLGLELVIKDISFEGLIVGLNQGKFDIILAGISITPQRQNAIALIPYQGEPVTGLTLAFWKQIPPHIQSLQDIETAVAVQVGTYQESYLSKIKGIEFKALEANTDLIMDLQYGKSQAALFEPHIANAMKAKFHEIQLMPINLPETEWVLGNGIGIKKDNIELIEKIKQAVLELKEEGVIEKLEQKWFGGMAHES